MQADMINFKALKIPQEAFNSFNTNYIKILQDRSSDIDKKINKIKTLVKTKQQYRMLYLAVFITSAQAIHVHYNNLYKNINCYCLQHEFVKLLSWYMFQKSYIDMADTNTKDINIFNGSTRIVSILYGAYLFIHGTNVQDISGIFNASWDKLIETKIKMNVNIFVHANIEVIMHIAALCDSLIKSPIHAIHMREEAKEEESETKETIH